MNNSQKPSNPTFTYNPKTGEVKGKFTGLNKREYFAGLAMQGLIANAPDQQLHNTVQGCELAVWWADALLKALEEPKTP